MDWVLSAMMLLSNFLLAKKIRWGWLILAIGCLCWIYYALTLAPPQYGLIPSATVNLVIAFMGWRHWKQVEKSERLG